MARTLRKATVPIDAHLQTDDQPIRVKGTDAEEELKKMLAAQSIRVGTSYEDYDILKIDGIEEYPNYYFRWIRNKPEKVTRRESQGWVVAARKMFPRLKPTTESNRGQAGDGTFINRDCILMFTTREFRNDYHKKTQLRADAQMTGRNQAHEELKKDPAVKKVYGDITDTGPNTKLSSEFEEVKDENDSVFDTID